MLVNAYAKINLLLDITSRLQNGMHSLCMVMQSIDLYDTVRVETTDGGIELTCSDPLLPVDASNIAYRAAELFFRENEISNVGARIHIEKRIPKAAGLAGGSADAAAVLYALNRLCATGLGELEMRRTGVKIGADVPFCLCGGTMLAHNVGEVLAPLPPLADCPIVLVKPERSVSTAEAYAQFDSAPCVRRLNTTAMINYAANADFEGICSCIGNMFEQFIEVPERIGIKEIMRRHGSIVCCMSGSGPSVFGIFKSEEQAHACLAELDGKYGNAYFCRPVRRGVRTVK